MDLTVSILSKYTELRNWNRDAAELLGHSIPRALGELDLRGVSRMNAGSRVAGTPRVRARGPGAGAACSQTEPLPPSGDCALGDVGGERWAGLPASWPDTTPTPRAPGGAPVRLHRQAWVVPFALRFWGWRPCVCIPDAFPSAPCASREEAGPQTACVSPPFRASQSLGRNKSLHQPGVTA